MGERVAAGYSHLVDACCPCRLHRRCESPHPHEGPCGVRGRRLECGSFPAFLNTGHAFGSLDAGVMDKYPGYLHYFPLLGTAIHSVFLALLGPTLFAMRMTSLLFSVALLIIVYIIANKLYGNRAGLLSVLFTSLSVPFIYSSHMGRHDIIITAPGFDAVALYLTDNASSLSVKSVLSGLAVSLTLDIHMNGLIYIPLIGALYLLEYRLSVLRPLVSGDLSRA